MKIFLLLPLLFAPSAHAFEVLVTGLRNNAGMVRCSVFRSEEGFPSDHTKAVLRISVAPQELQAVVEFKDLPDGEYAIAVLHDEDGDSKMRTNFIGLPQEGWAVSNNAPARTFGPPTFAAALKSWKRGERASITIRY